MKKLILSTFLCISSLIASDIKVEVSGLLNQNGKLSIGLYNKNNDTFANMSKDFRSIDLTINNNQMTYTFSNIPDGTYAIAILHDENQNKRLDKNFLGVPSEGYGFSNNIRPLFRGASFEESKFILESDTIININIGY